MPGASRSWQAELALPIHSFTMICFVKEFIGARRRLYELDEIPEHELLVFAVVGQQLLPL